jgi:hypothetical protein
VAVFEMQTRVIIRRLRFCYIGGGLDKNEIICLGGVGGGVEAFVPQEIDAFLCLVL